MAASPIAVGDVFVPGGLPTVTYNPRAELGLEARVEDFLAEGHRMLSLSGPTKSGKTVLLKSLVQDAIWLSGGSVSSVDDIWSAVVDELQVGLTLTETEGEQDETSKEWSTEGGASPLGVGVRTARTSSEGYGASRGSSVSRDRSVKEAGRQALRGAGRPMVIDDFHYIDPSVQVQIVRGLKDLIFEGVRVIVAAVPHRAYDAVRVEKEMTGRVEQLPIDFWSKDELAEIADVGFRALNVTDVDGSLASRLASEAFSSPHLMQDFCLGLCKENGVRVEQVESVVLQTPDWPAFLRSRASTGSKTAFDLLARGPRQRADRNERVLVGGSVTDIYGAVLAAIAYTGPLTEMTYEQLRSALRDVIKGDPPQRHEVTRVLEKMSEIAREQIAGEAVVDFDVELGKLYISDPFFAYYLRWGDWVARAQS